MAANAAIDQAERTRRVLHIVLTVGELVRLTGFAGAAVVDRQVDGFRVRVQNSREWNNGGYAPVELSTEAIRTLWAHRWLEAEVGWWHIENLLPKAHPKTERVLITVQDRP